MKTWGRFIVALLAAVVAVCAGAPAALASTVTLSTTQPDPYVGEPVTFTATSSSSSDTNFNFFVDGVQQTTALNNSSKTFHYTFSGPPAQHTVSVQAMQCSDCPSDGSQEVTETVVSPISGSIGVSPSQPQVDQQVTLTANVSGGHPPLSYAWNTTGGSSFSNGSGQSVHATFSTTGNHTVKVRVTDAASPHHVQVLTRTITVSVVCEKTLDFGLAEVTTNGCLTPVSDSNPKAYETTAAIKLNGIPFPAAPQGTHYTVTLPGGSAPGGEVDLGTSSIDLGGFVAFRGHIDWKLPAGGKGDEKQVAMLSVPGGTKIKGLTVGGSIALRLGYGSNGVHYAAFPLNVDLPDVFKSGPSGQSGGVSASASLRVDDEGVHYDGLRLEASNVWVGQLQVKQVCFSFVPAGASQSVSPCPVPTLEGQPFIECATNSNVDRWDGNADLILPTQSHPRLALFGGLAGGSLSKLGGFADNLGTSFPLVDGVYLTRVGVGLCLSPPPFKLRGVVGVSVLPVGKSSTLTVNGSVLYTDAYTAHVFGLSIPVPWSLQLSGNMILEGVQVGSGSVTIRPTGDIDFAVNSSFHVLSVISLNISLSGWIEIPRKAFNIDGNGRACIKSVCAGADAVLSSVGLAGCLDLGHIDYYVLVKNSNWHWYTPWRVHWEKRTTYLQAGFGYRWHSSSVSLFGGSCDLGSFSASRAADVRAAGGGATFAVAHGTPAIAVRIQGSAGPPTVVVTGPGGERITSPSNGGSSSSPGKYVLVPNPSDGSTSLLLINPAAGTWTITPTGASKVVGVKTAPFLAPPDVTGAVVSGPNGSKTVSLAYAEPSGDSISLVERGKGVEHTIAVSVHGKACPGPNRPGGERLRCVEVGFKPAFGQGGQRQIIALVTRNGMPEAELVVASFNLGQPAVPSKPGHLQLVRRNGGVAVAWAPVSRAASYTVSVKLSNGRMFGKTVSADCRGVLLPSVASSVAATVEVAGVRQDLVTGPFGRATLRAGQGRSGAPGPLPGPIC